MLTVKATGKADWYNSVGNTAAISNSWNGTLELVNGTDKTLTPCTNAYASGNTYYYPHNQTLHARLFLKQTGDFDSRGTRTADWQDNSALNTSAIDEASKRSADFRYDTVRKCAALSVARPYLEVHSYVRYGNADNYTNATEIGRAHV